MKAFDAIVIGAGPAGGSTAFFLSELGFKVAVVERSEFPRRKVCGEFISATTFPIFDAIGIGDDARALGGPPIHRVGVMGRSTVVTAPMPAVESSSGPGRTVSRDVLDVLLLDAARSKGAHVFQPWKALSLHSTSEDHILTIRSEERREQLRAPILIAAHGSWEVGALPTQPQKSHRPDDLLAFKAYYRNAKFDRDLISLIGFPGGYGGIVLRDEETVGLSACIRREVLAGCRERFGERSAGEDVFRHVVASVRGIAETLEGAILECAPLAAGPLRPGIRSGYAEGIFRVGNAAGEAHPAIAEGISIAIQSGLLLANNLAQLAGSPADRQSLDGVGDRYDAAWRAQFGGRLRASEVYARACMSPVAGAILAPILSTFPGLLTFGAILSGKTKPLTRTGNLRPLPLKEM